MYYLKISFRTLMLIVVLVMLSIGIRSATAATSTQGHPASSCGIWHVAPGPNVRSFNNNLRAVAAVSSGDIWAVGSTYSNQILSPSSTLTDHWNGTRWSIVPSPNVGSSFNQLDGVAVVSASDVWAVGNYISQNPAKTLIEHWNGTSWS